MRARCLYHVVESMSVHPVAYIDEVGGAMDWGGGKVVALPFSVPNSCQVTANGWCFRASRHMCWAMHHGCSSVHVCMYE